MRLENGGKGSSSLMAQSSLLRGVDEVRRGGDRMVDVIFGLVS